MFLHISKITIFFTYCPGRGGTHSVKSGYSVLTYAMISFDEHNKNDVIRYYIEILCVFDMLLLKNKVYIWI